MSDLHILEAEKYYQALLREIPKAKKRIVIAAMVMTWGERTAPIFIMLGDALRRGVEVTLLYDTFTRLPALYGLMPRATRGERTRQTFHTFETLKASGAKVYEFGKIGLPPQKGRCHVKVTVIDDTSYSFGGVNFFDQGFDCTDYMLESHDPEVADCLAQLVERIGTTRPPLHDGEVPLGKEMSVLFDGGRQKHSIIYERACELAAQSKRVWYISQMSPSGQLAYLLNETHAKVYFNRPEQMMQIGGMAQSFDQHRYHVRNKYQGEGYIHAKFILFELHSGRTALLSGSNNFSYRGVAYGTQEVCLYSTDSTLWKALRSYAETYVLPETAHIPLPEKKPIPTA